MNLAAVPGPVLIIGTGLLGTSLGLALRELGVEVWLSDSSPAAQNLARDLGAGTPVDEAGGGEPTLVVVATPPDVVVPAALDALRDHPTALVTDVASVKSVIEVELLAAAGESGRRYLGSHPMAGREKSGAAAADPDLFQGRTWVIAAREDADPAGVTLLRAVATAVGAIPHLMSAHEHDAAVAAVSHLPQLMASVTAAQLSDVEPGSLTLAGQGLRDTTRIAASDPMMWSAIFSANAAALLPHVEAARERLAEMAEALATASASGPSATGVMGTFAGVIESGRDGVSRIPGKHGGAARRYAEVTVMVPDEPGQLGRLFSEVGELGVNIEDFRMEHAAGARLGVATLSVAPVKARELAENLENRGWKVMA